MDPQALWNELVAELKRDTASRDRASTVEMLRNLADWIEKGGFLPRP